MIRAGEESGRFGSLGRTASKGGCVLACAAFFVSASPPAAAEPPPAQRIVLIGDAGKAAREPGVLRALGPLVAGDARRRSLVVFLGDNAYRQPATDGPPRRWPDLDEQITGAAKADDVVFLPGNHDWGDTTEDGLAVLRREADYLAARSAGRKPRMEPPPGCPGPRRLVDSGLVRVLAIDSSWWLRDANERTLVSSASNCAYTTTRAAAAALTADLACEGPGPCPPRVVVAHHPLLSYGSHAGYFGWQEHFVCASYLPLPGLCSFYIGLRKLGIGDQDMASPAYRSYIEEIKAALSSAPPLAFAAGHEHVLQVLRGEDEVWHVISGSGSRLGRVGRGPKTEYAREALGLATLDFEIEGSVTLKVYVLGADGLRADYEKRLLPDNRFRASVEKTRSSEVGP